ncbi:HAD family hydrolase [Leifsonia sp. A12D58]|uniref:HAD family hydrolase n=1 Tax=Leifsonia sp. A12D58 TaxID=3397674 RepID=UPI0039E1B29B
MSADEAAVVASASHAAVILFDLDDTLFEHRRAVDEGIVRHVHALGGEFAARESAETVTLWHSLEEEHYHAYLAGELDYEGQRRARARDFAAAHGVELSDSDSGVWFDSYFEQYVERWALHSDALSCLDALAAAIPGVRFGVITNGDLAFQTRKMAGMGLTDRVEHLITSGELGIAKPDPRIFEAACEVFGVSPTAAVYVGDRLATDAIGAAAAGLTGVWLDRIHAPVSVPDAADAWRLGVIRIAGLSELPAALAPMSDR